jgi:hypothetical protein
MEKKCGVTTTPLSFRNIQTVWAVAIAFAIVCIVFGGFTRKAFEGGLNWRHGILLGLVGWSALSGLSIRRKLLHRASSGAKGSNSGAPAKTWVAAQLLGIMLAGSMVAWGLVSNVVIASPLWLSDAIYVAGILLMFRFKPSKPSCLPS